MASVFLGKYASITVEDLIQQKKLGSWKFCESNLAEARFEGLEHDMSTTVIVIDSLSSHKV